MGLDGAAADLPDDGDGFGGTKALIASSVPCSICLDVVTDDGDRSWAKLQCGHRFHLDCIGSAFNIKGAMQCPNCRKIEKGQWLYANSCRPLHEFSMDDWTQDEDLYDLSYYEMSFGVQWCPFSGLARLPSSFDEGEFSSTAYHDLLGQHAIFAEHSSASSPCPYISYLRPMHPSVSNSSAGVSDGPNFNNHWNGPSIPNDIPNSYAFPTVDLHYHSWEHHRSPFSSSSSHIVGTDQPSIPSALQRLAQTSSDVPRSRTFVHPFLVGHHSSGARAGAAAPPFIPPYPGSNTRARDRVHALQAYYQQQPPSSNPLSMRAPLVPGTRRSSVQVGTPVAPSSHQSSSFYFFPSSTASSRNFQEPENAMSARFPGWERDHYPSFPVNRVDGDSGPSMRPNGFRQRHGSERTSHNRS